MRATWNELAVRNAMYFIATDTEHWTVPDFLASGVDDLDLLLSPANAPTGGKLALDYGCGIGRLSLALAKRYDQVVGVDVSEVMIAKADELKAKTDEGRVDYHVANGCDLSTWPDDHFDLVLSYVVLQHVPNEATVVGLLREFARVTKPGGYVVVQFPAYRRSVFARPWRRIQLAFRRALGVAERLRLVTPERGTAFRGSRIRLPRAIEALKSYGVKPLTIERSKTTYRLCESITLYGKKRTAD
jgi:2-polyprenyl-3-methyl-5-hydroxy-6-metoxy-1,4-benzoquinol methylase